MFHDLRAPALVNKTTCMKLAIDPKVDPLLAILKHLLTKKIEMSWLNEELPVDWPTHNNNQSSFHDGFSTSRSNGSMEINPTVAIQESGKVEKPQWKHAIQMPQKVKENSHRLTRLFVPPQIPSVPEKEKSFKYQKKVRYLSDNGEFDKTDTSQSDSQESSSLPNSSVRNEESSENFKRPVDRRLKVFGRPDTYTNERLGNLLSSMSGVHPHDSSSNMNPSASLSVPERKPNVDTSANDSDADLAGKLQNEGRKVLQGLAPFRPNLSAVQESSLDQLELQLTNKKTDSPKTNPRATLETTWSSADFSSSRTLDSLPAGISNWDTFGGHFESPRLNIQPRRTFNQAVDRAPNPIERPGRSLLREHSSQTLVGSGRSVKPFWSTRSSASNKAAMHDAEAEISTLGIQEPIESGTNQQLQLQLADLSAENSIQKFSTEFSTSSEQLTTQSAESRIDNEQQIPTTPFGRSGSGSNILRSRPSRLRFTSSAYDTTPDHLARKYLQFTPTARPASANHRDEGPVLQPNGADSLTPDHSIIVKNVSFSAGYECLAQLIRERSNHPFKDSLSTIDSLDLSNSKLESVVGLNQFVPQLTTLFLNDNKVRSLQGLPFNLVHLDMSNNHLSNVNLFPMSFISTLIVSGNEITSLEPMANLRALSSLDISNNKLKSLKGLENLTALRTLNVRNNQLTTVDINLGLLVELDAAYNEITAVKLEAPNLESLNLESNQIMALTEPLPNLRELNMRFNNATINFKGWNSLEILLFDGNKALRNLESVSGMLVTFSWEQPRSENEDRDKLSSKIEYNGAPPTCLTCVRDLKLAGRRSGWPFLSTNMTFTAQHLDLSLCNIRELPDSFPEMFPFLTSLNLAFNKLNAKCIPILAKCKKLERLSLFGNRLNISGEKLARSIPHLRMLDSRSQNRIKHGVEKDNYSTDIYSAIIEKDTTEASTIVETASDLQWIDGRWTKNAGNTKQTIRPGFQSPLYPEEWNPPSKIDIALEATMELDTTMIDSVCAMDIVEAMYAHFYLQARSH